MHIYKLRASYQLRKRLKVLQTKFKYKTMNTKIIISKFLILHLLIIHVKVVLYQHT